MSWGLVGIGLVISGILLWKVPIQLHELFERHRLYRKARNYCDRVHKPLLRIGMRRSPLEPPNGDTTLDIEPSVTELPGGV